MRDIIVAKARARFKNAGTTSAAHVPEFRSNDAKIAELSPKTESKRLLFRTTAPEGRVLASRIFLFSRGPMRGPQVPKQG